MANGLPEEFPFNRRRYPRPEPVQAAPPPPPPPQLSDEEVQEVAEVAEAAAMATALISRPSPFSQEAVRGSEAFTTRETVAHEPTPAPADYPRLVPAPGLGIERRRAVRQTLVARATIRPETNYAGIGPSASGYVSNISLKGIGFHTRRPLIIGERYSIRLEVGPMRWQSRLRVVACNPHPSGTYDIGAEFVVNELQIRAPKDVAA